ncbi:MAG: 30S ribosomal protein S8 [Planctomycetes bacterium]|nr:30S ribosomal protein S8 [Planctomycetota bacterium]
MTMTDPIADMLTRIRNANDVRKQTVDIPLSRIKLGIAAILKDEGYIDGYDVQPEERALRVHLRYGRNGERVIQSIRRTSKPGCRVYSGFRDLPKVLGGLGIAILSTPHGIISDRKAREHKVGGEVLCVVY